MDKLKVLWVSDLVAPTGFSRVSHSIIENLGDEFDITGVGINYHGDPHKYTFPIFPASLGSGNIYGENRVIDLLNSRDYDILFILNDVWVINKYLQAIKKHVKKELPKIVVYFPVDAEQHDPEWYENFDIVDVPVVYTEFGLSVAKAARPNIDFQIIPHGIDTKKFYSLGNKWSSKMHLFGNKAETIGSEEESFIVLNANRNQPRKRLDVTMRGFSLFAKDKPDSVKLYMHCGVVDASIHVGKLAVRYGIDKKLVVTSQKRGIQTVPDSRLNEIYNACDIGINTGMGEGWGLTNVEHAVTGAIQLVPDHSACRELFSDCGVLLETSDDYMFDNSLTVGRLVKADEVANKLQYIYDNRKEMSELAQKAVDKFTSDKYTWKHISTLWKGIFLGNNKDVSTLSN